MVIVITGPIASGKSTVARELAGELERGGLTVAVIDLDVLYDTLVGNGSKADGATWTLARHEAATLTNTFVEQGQAVVIVEGSFNRPSHRATLARYLNAGADPHYVALRVSFEEALRRAQGDPTRGVSRDPVVLGSYFAKVSPVLAGAPATDIVIDTERMTPTDAAAAIASLVRPASA
jgi:shikimate kinase